MSATLTLEVDSVAVGGDGVARETGGRVVFVPRTAPGDRVEARLVEEHDRWARAHPLRIVRPGPGRTAAPCPLYDDCGGCQLQHLDRPSELEAKRRAVGDALARIGGREVEVEPARDPGPPLGYRNRISLTLRRSEAGAVAGYHRWPEPDRLVDVERCPLAEEPVNRALGELRSAWGPDAGALPDGEELRLTLRGARTGAVGLLVEGGGGGRGAPGRLAEAVTDLAGLWWRPEGGGLQVLAGAPTFPDRWEETELELRPDTFLQVNRVVAAALEEYLDARIAERSGGPEGRRLLDLYAGVGLRAIRWAEAGARAVGCERDEGAVESGRRAAEARGVAVDLLRGDVEDRLAELLPADVAVVNPPRTGLSEEVTDVLALGAVPAIVYVSCDPATLARDVKRLGERWRVVSVQPFDAFPQTAHVESVAWLEAG